MRLVITAVALVGLGACTQVPDSAVGVGFNNSLTDRSAREAMLAGEAPLNALPPATAISDEPLSAAANTQQPVATAASSLPPATVATSAAPETDAVLEAAASLQEIEANSGVAPLQASPSNPPPQIVDTSVISDENDFQAVSSRQSIESDAERLAQLEASRQVVQPTAVPTRAGGSQPNIVEYALETQHPRGTRIYSRTGINLAGRSQRNCAKFASPDQAQIEFLSSGGPERDRRALDPDGDGFACAWDPAPFRSAVQN